MFNRLRKKTKKIKILKSLYKKQSRKMKSVILKYDNIVIHADNILENDKARDRAVLEAEELNIKIVKLSKFINSHLFCSVDKKQRILLKRQIGAMNEYYITLKKRLYSWPKDVN